MLPCGSRRSRLTADWLGDSAVCARLGDGRQARVHSFFFLKHSKKNSCGVWAAKLFSPSEKRAVTRDLVMLYPLHVRSNHFTQNITVINVSYNLVKLLEQAIYYGTIDTLRFPPEYAKHFFNTRNMSDANIQATL